MTLNIETPALLFSATSLILLAYTNRFLTIASIVRGLKRYMMKKKIKLSYWKSKPQLTYHLNSLHATFRGILSVPFRFCHVTPLSRSAINGIYLLG
jgi:hypothetical protein